MTCQQQQQQKPNEVYLHAARKPTESQTLGTLTWRCASRSCRFFSLFLEALAV